MHTVQNIEHQWIPMADGVRLSARIWLPTHAHTTPVPAILEYIPYRKRDMVRVRDERNHPVFAQHGYAAVRVDMRGSGDSQGSMSDMYSADELDDAIAVIEWIAEQTWCNANVGMMGTSWGGTSSLQAASRRPAALKAIIAVCATNNRYDDDIHHMGGCLLTDSVEWGATLPAILASPPDPATVGQGWREIWQQRLEQLAFPLEQWIAHETRDSYWQWGSVNERPGAIVCPVLMIGGWADRYSNTVMNLVGHSPSNCWGIVGGWGHHYPDQANPSPGIAFQQEALRWWDHWLRGIDNEVDKEPRLRIWMQEYVKPKNAINTRPGRWVSEPVWPAKNIQMQTLYLDNGLLTHLAPQTSGSAGMTSDVPGSLGIGAAAGDTGYFGRAGGLPLDQREDDKQSLVFESEPLKEPLEILGSVSLNATLTRERSASTLVVRLNDVHPDGSVARVSYVIRNLALDEKCIVIDTHDPTHAKQIALQFHNTAYRFAAGHRIRLALSSTYWPMIWPSPVIARITVLHDSVRLCLPVREELQHDEAINFKELSEPGQTPDLDPGYLQRCSPELKRWTNTSDDGLVQSIQWHQPFRCIYYPHINLEFGFETRALHKVTLTDPSSATSRFEHTLQFSRDDWQIQVNCTAELTATTTHFKVDGKILITENNNILFTRQWNPEIKRTCS